jgi:FMN-dependent NADH-azoreductase
MPTSSSYHDYLISSLKDALEAAAYIEVMGVPMYNFSIPSALKAYIDQIVRIGRTFAFIPENPANPYQPLVLGKKMFIIAARGGSGFGAGGQYEQMNFQTPYLATVFVVAPLQIISNNEVCIPVMLCYPIKVIFLQSFPFMMRHN